MKPFDLEAAKRGEPIQTVKGVSAKFITHVPEAAKDFSLVVLMEDSGGLSIHMSDGRHLVDENRDLCMAPKKRTIWLNIILLKNMAEYASIFNSEAEALAYINNSPSDARFLLKAHKIELQEEE